MDSKTPTPSSKIIYLKDPNDIGFTSIASGEEVTGATLP